MSLKLWQNKLVKKALVKERQTDRQRKGWISNALEGNTIWLYTFLSPFPFFFFFFSFFKLKPKKRKNPDAGPTDCNPLRIFHAPNRLWPYAFTYLVIHLDHKPEHSRWKQIWRKEKKKEKKEKMRWPQYEQLSVFSLHFFHLLSWWWCSGGWGWWEKSYRGCNAQIQSCHTLSAHAC